MVRFKHTHPRYPKTAFLTRGVQRYGCLERHPRTHTIFFGMVRFGPTHPRYPKTVFLPGVCRCMGVWGATPEPTQHFLAWCVSNTPILGIQRHFFWTVVCRGICVWSTTPEPTQFSLAWCGSDTLILGIQKQLFWPWCAEACLFGAPTQNRHNIFWHHIQGFCIALQGEIAYQINSNGPWCTKSTQTGRGVPTEILKIGFIFFRIACYVNMAQCSLGKPGSIFLG